MPSSAHDTAHDTALPKTRLHPAYGHVTRINSVSEDFIWGLKAGTSILLPPRCVCFCTKIAFVTVVVVAAADVSNPAYDIRYPLLYHHKLNRLDTHVTGYILRRRRMSTEEQHTVPANYKAPSASRFLYTNKHYEKIYCSTTHCTLHNTYLLYYSIVGCIVAANGAFVRLAYHSTTNLPESQWLQFLHRTGNKVDYNSMWHVTE